jgi:serine/threonine-protein phosphatase 2A regulatory subunit A
VQVNAIKSLPLFASAIDEEKTRDELIPCLANRIYAMSNESCFNLAEQLERLVPLVGGNDYVGILLNMLVKLACEGEVLVRERALESMRNICENLENEEYEKFFYPLIENMITSNGLTTKCSAGYLINVGPPFSNSFTSRLYFQICYAKMSLDKQTKLKSLVDFVHLIDKEHLKSEFVPIFDNLAKDNQVSLERVPRYGTTTNSRTP